MRNAAVLVVAMLTPAAAAAKAGLREVARGELCVTLGALGSTAGGLVVEGPKMRAVVGVHTEPVAELRFTYLGPTRETAPLASGQTRRQIGLKLRALDGCNLIYVMYRIEPKPSLVVSVKRNPGMRTHAECGARGYINVKPLRAARVPAVHTGDVHVLGAAMHGPALVVRLDGNVVWEGDVGSVADGVEGPVGIRSDGGRFELHLRARLDGRAAAACTGVTAKDAED